MKQVKVPRKDMNDKVGIKRSDNYMSIPIANVIIVVIILTILSFIGGRIKRLINSVAPK